MKLLVKSKIIDGWIVCPLCGKKQFRVENDTEIKNLRFRCRSSNGKSEHFILVNKKKG